jgi:hypothetical protein
MGRQLQVFRLYLCCLACTAHPMQLIGCRRSACPITQGTAPNHYQPDQPPEGLETHTFPSLLDKNPCAWRPSSAAHKSGCDIRGNHKAAARPAAPPAAAVEEQTRLRVGAAGRRQARAHSPVPSGRKV